MNKVNSIQNFSVSILKATSEQKQFYSEFSFSFLPANPQQSQFDSEFLLKESLDKINYIIFRFFLPKGTSERNRFYSAFSLLPKRNAEQNHLSRNQNCAFCFQAGNFE